METSVKTTFNFPLQRREISLYIAIYSWKKIARAQKIFVAMAPSNKDFLCMHALEYS